MKLSDKTEGVLLYYEWGYFEKDFCNVLVKCEILFISTIKYLPRNFSKDIWKARFLLQTKNTFSQMYVCFAILKIPFVREYGALIISNRNNKRNNIAEFQNQIFNNKCYQKDGDVLCAILYIIQCLGLYITMFTLVMHIRNTHRIIIQINLLYALAFDILPNILRRIIYIIKGFQSTFVWRGYHSHYTHSTEKIFTQIQ